jgi:hypothetical protein
MITEYFANLTSALQADYAAASKDPRRGEMLKKLSERLLTPLLPASIRHGSGFVLDILERQAGPFDVVAVSDFWPPIGQGPSSVYLADGVIFCLSARNWAAQDLTEFAAQAKELKSLKRKTPLPLLCAAFSYTPLEAPEVMEFMKSNAGASLDAVFSLGKNLVVRNNLGWYGDPKTIPFVSEPTAAPALKFFAFYLLQAVHAAAGVPFALADYQHL